MSAKRHISFWNYCLLQLYLHHQTIKRATQIYMKTSRDTSQLYEKIRKMRAVTEVARRSGYHRNHVMRVLRGEYENLDILETAAKYVQEVDERKSQVYELIRVAV